MGAEDVYAEILEVLLRIAATIEAECDVIQIDTEFYQLFFDKSDEIGKLGLVVLVAIIQAPDNRDVEIIHRRGSNAELAEIVALLLIMTTFADETPPVPGVDEGIVVAVVQRKNTELNTELVHDPLDNQVPHAMDLLGRDSIHRFSESL